MDILVGVVVVLVAVGLYAYFTRKSKFTSRVITEVEDRLK